MRYLLDTSTVSAYFRAGPTDPLPERVRSLGGELAIASLVWHELRFGQKLLPDGRRKEALTQFLDTVVLPNFTVLGYERSAAEWHATERVRLRALGIVAPFVDGQIAAIAAVNGLTVVTNNVRHFEWFEGLLVEQWP